MQHIQDVEGGETTSSTQFKQQQTCCFKVIFIQVQRKFTSVETKRLWDYLFINLSPRDRQRSAVFRGLYSSKIKSWKIFIPQENPIFFFKITYGKVEHKEKKNSNFFKGQ
jgi:hypothetical protein